MKNDNSFFRSNRMVYKGPEAPPSPAAEPILPDFADKATREKLYKDVQDQVDTMDKKDPNRKPLVDFLGLAKNYHEKNIKAAEYWSEKLYEKLLLLPTRPTGPRGDVLISPIDVYTATGKQTYDVPQPKAKAEAREAVASAPTKPATRASIAREARDFIASIGQAPDIAGPYVTNFPENAPYAVQQAIRRLLDVRRADNDFPLKTEVGGTMYEIKRTKSASGTYIYDIKESKA